MRLVIQKREKENSICTAGWICRRFPDYLKIEETIKSPDEFKTYAQKLKRLDAPYGTLFENAGQNVSNPSELESYIRRIV